MWVEMYSAVVSATIIQVTRFWNIWRMYWSIKNIKKLSDTEYKFTDLHYIVNEHIAYVV